MSFPQPPASGPPGFEKRGSPTDSGPRVVDPDVGTVTLMAGVLLMVASVLPWLTYPGFGGGGSISGLDTDGQETIVCGLAVVVLGILVKAVRARLWAPITGVVFSGIAIFSVGYRVVEVISQRGDGSEVSPSVGLYAAAALSLLCLYATIRCLRVMGPAADFGR